MISMFCVGYNCLQIPIQFQIAGIQTAKKCVTLQDWELNTLISSILKGINMFFRLSGKKLKIVFSVGRFYLL